MRKSFWTPTRARSIVIRALALALVACGLSASLLAHAQVDDAPLEIVSLPEIRGIGLSALRVNDRVAFNRGMIFYVRPAQPDVRTRELFFSNDVENRSDFDPSQWARLRFPDDEEIVVTEVAFKRGSPFSLFGPVPWSCKLTFVRAADPNGRSYNLFVQGRKRDPNPSILFLNWR
jgi:hypothetical protein